MRRTYNNDIAKESLPTVFAFGDNRGYTQIYDLIKRQLLNNRGIVMVDPVIPNPIYKYDSAYMETIRKSIYRQAKECNGGVLINPYDIDEMIKSQCRYLFEKGKFIIIATPRHPFENVLNFSFHYREVNFRRTIHNYQYIVKQEYDFGRANKASIMERRRI